MFEFLDAVEKEMWNKLYEMNNEFDKSKIKSGFGTASATKPLTMEDILKTVEKLKELPPVAFKMEVSRAGLEILKAQATNLDKLAFDDIDRLSGIKIIENNNGDFDYNEAKVYYDDGTTKIIEVFKKKRYMDIVWGV